MRLQLIVLAIFSLPLFLLAQVTVSTDSTRRQKTNAVDVDFLFNYYQQDGNHSAVTGGTGTQELNDFDGQIVAYTPIDSVSALNFQMGMNYYTSASTDNIDFRISSASRHDLRVQGYVTYSRKPDSENSFDVTVGSSIESDYISKSLSARYTRSSDDRNRNFSILASAYLDNWVVIFPQELRKPGLASLETGKRQSFSMGSTFQQVISKRTQAEFSAGLVWQRGLLSTPFHRVYFSGKALPRIENLPDSRLKFPLTLQVNHFFGSHLVTRLSYRFYFDSFRISGNSFLLETPVKFSPSFTLTPFYRFHSQSASRYFEAFAEHDSTVVYYTSDYDLSDFNSHRAGIGIHIAPANGILNSANRNRRKAGGMMDEMGLRTSCLLRSDGLRAWMASLNLSFQWR